MEEKKIEVTKEDLMKATTKMCIEDENTSKLTNSIPLMLMVIPVITLKLWDQLVKIKEENENGEAE